MFVIKKENLEKLKDGLAEKSELIDLRENDVLSFKKYFFLPEEEIFSFNKKENRLAEQKKPEPFVLFGLNLRDTEALVQLDEIMKNDFYYFQKRKSATVVSITEEDGSIPHIGIDLILEKTSNSEYKAHSLTEKGREITKSKLFVATKSDFVANIEVGLRNNNEFKKLLLDPELLKDAVEWSWTGYPEIWEKLGKQCLGCGVCTYVCPLCHCFSTEDKCALNGKTCSRIRKWTACTLPEFSKVTGDHKFHPTLKERYYNWFFHKFVRAYKEYGKSQCVACGRCKDQCPAGIEIGEVLLEIVNKYKKVNKKING